MPNYPKIFVYDIEALRLHADWGMMLTCAWKELNKGKVHIRCLWDYPEYKKSKVNDKGLVKDVYKELSKADMLIGHYARFFDFKFIQSRLVKHKLKTLPYDLPQEDTWWIAFKKLQLSRNSLAHISEWLFGETDKTKLGECLIRSAMGYKKDQNYVKKHNIIDVEETEKVYNHLKKLTAPKINVNLFMGTTMLCPECGSAALAKAGLRSTRTALQQRYRCKVCGKWGYTRLTGGVIR